MRLIINSDAAHFHKYKCMSYAFTIEWDNFEHRESWFIPVDVDSSTHAEFIWIWKAITYLFDRWIYYDSIIIKCDNVWVTVNRKKYSTNKLLPYIIELRSKILEYKRLIRNKYWKKNRPINWQYAQSRKWIDKWGMQKWCDRECKNIWRKNIPELAIKTTIGELKNRYNEWFNCVVPLKSDFRKTIKKYYIRHNINE